VKVLLYPVTVKLDYNTLCLLAKDISREFENVKVTVGNSIESHSNPEFQSAFERRRNQWDSFKLLESY
jgi:archaemetzincin